MNNKRNIKKELLLPGSMKWENGVMRWEKKGGHAGRNVIARVLAAAATNGWKSSDVSGETSQSGNTRRGTQVSDGKFIVSVSSYYGDTKDDNRFSITVSEVALSKNV